MKPSSKYKNKPLKEGESVERIDSDIDLEELEGEDQEIKNSVREEFEEESRLQAKGKAKQKGKGKGRGRGRGKKGKALPPESEAKPVERNLAEEFEAVDVASISDEHEVEA